MCSLSYLRVTHTAHLFDFISEVGRFYREVDHQTHKFQFSFNKDDFNSIYRPVNPVRSQMVDFWSWRWKWAVLISCHDIPALVCVRACWVCACACACAVKGLNYHIYPEYTPLSLLPWRHKTSIMWTNWLNHLHRTSTWTSLWNPKLLMVLCVCVWTHKLCYNTNSNCSTLFHWLLIYSSDCNVPITNIIFIFFFFLLKSFFFCWLYYWLFYWSCLWDCSASLWSLTASVTFIHTTRLSISLVNAMINHSRIQWTLSHKTSPDCTNMMSSF